MPDAKSSDITVLTATPLSSPVRRVIKLGTFIIAVCVALPLVILYRFGALLMGSVAAFQIASHFAALFPGGLGDYFRLGFYKLTLQRCARESVISFGTIFSTPKCAIGRHVSIGAYCIISASTIEDDVLIGSHVHIISGKETHNYSSLSKPIRLQGGSNKSIQIGRGTWIANGSIVMADIGRECVIGAGSVVAREIREYSIVSGNPARLIGRRTDLTNEPSV